MAVDVNSIKVNSLTPEQVTHVKTMGPKQHAQQAMRDGDYSRAATHWQAAIKLTPKDPTLHSKLGDAFAALERVNEAEFSYERAVKLAPKDGHSYLALGELALRRPFATRRRDALKLLRHATDMQPKSPTAWLLLGAAMNEEAHESGFNQALLDEAAKALRKAARLGPADPTVHWQLGDVLSARGERRLAVRSLATAVRLQPDHVEAYSSLARILSYEALSPVARRLAAWAFRRALAAKPQHLETWHNLGEYLHAQGEPANAAKAFSRATKIAPSSGASHLSLGESLQRLCRLEEAQTHYTRAAALMPRSARAQIHALLGRTDMPSNSSSTAVEEEQGEGAASAVEVSTTGRVHSSRQRPLPPAHALRVEPDYSTIASNSSWSGRAVDILSEHGVAVVQGAVPKSTCDALLKQIEEWPATAEGTSGTTRQPHRRRHQALPMRHNASGAAVHALMETLGDTLRQALGSADQSGVRVVECGFLTSEPGAQAQAFHADTAPARLHACEARTLKVQLALVDVTADMGPLEVVPGSHEDDFSFSSKKEGLAEEVVAALGQDESSSSSGVDASAVEKKEEEPILALPILVRAGDATIYWSSLHHRGGANTANSKRPTFHIAAIGEGGAPTGMPYTVLVDDLLAIYGEGASSEWVSPYVHVTR